MIAHKHQKWDPQWQSRISAFSKQLDQGQNKQVELLLKEGNALHSEQDKLSKEIRQLKQEQKSLSTVFTAYRQAEKELQRLNTHQTTQEPRQANFLGTGSGTKYQTNGWLNNVQNHFTSSGTLDNLYKVKIEGGEVEATEEQIIQLIARVVKALQKVDSSDFEAKYNAKESDSTKQAAVKAYLKEIQDQAKEVVVGSSKDSDGQVRQPSYDFASTYQKYDKSTNSWTNYSAPAFNYQHFCEFISLVEQVSQNELKQAYRLVQADLAHTFLQMQPNQTLRLSKLGKFTKRIVQARSGLDRQTYVYYRINFSPFRALKQALNQSLENGLE